jgi:photosystem II stability/assembly factor-like uncharacterized protein
MSSLLDTRSIFALASTDAVCYAATDAGLWRVESRASARWQSIAPQFASVPLLAVAAAGDTVWIGANGDIAVSRDGGESWGLSTLPIRAEVQMLAVSPDYAQDHMVLAATARDGVLRSVDGGATFHAWNFGLFDLGISGLAISPNVAADSCVAAVSDQAVFVSRNGGRAWRELSAPPEASMFTCVAFDISGALLAGTEASGLWTAVTSESPLIRDETFRPESVNALHGAIAATPDGIFQRRSKSWKRIAAHGNALCLAGFGSSLLFGGESTGVQASAL